MWQVEANLAALDRPSSASEETPQKPEGAEVIALEDSNGSSVLPLGASEAHHRQEIARLEAEMARLWGPLYKPPVNCLICTFTLIVLHLFFAAMNL